MSGEKTVIKKLPEYIDKISEEALSMIDRLTAETGLPIYMDPKTGAPMWLDVRELRLRYTLPVKSIVEFFEALRNGVMKTTKCKECGTIYFPPQIDCPKCRVRNMEWIEVEKEGELVTWTVINTKPLTFSYHNDYVVGIVRMPQGFNILAWVRTTDPRKLAPGAKMRLKIGRREDENYISYWFEPVE
ncbi:3-hydroxybutyryl-CoA epimerase [Desulfurococcaceae archaeon AG1]|jgi:uncharacterized OB-fold protein|nr:MAG: 3-hydroxybutyryl-CoA epimerase [Desulfurococcaceae archaeon]GAY26414.1 3-hydroxybutyryl-CoA epimerase [Desulfurococcaceae archaeon AG1]